MQRNSEYQFCTVQGFADYGIVEVEGGQGRAPDLGTVD